MQSAGEDFKVMRQSMPFGTTTEHGLFFVAYSSKVRKFERMLERMVGASGHGPADGLMSVSKAVSSGWWYVPTVQELAKLAAAGNSKL
jgi:porphyrinogen peroxidase